MKRAEIAANLPDLTSILYSHDVTPDSSTSSTAFCSVINVILNHILRGFGFLNYLLSKLCVFTQ